MTRTRLTALIVAVLIGFTLAQPAVAAPSKRLGSTAVKEVTPAKPWQCGVRINKPDGTPWTCYIVDQFGGTTLNSKLWTVGKSSSSAAAPYVACWSDNPNNVKVGGGVLKLTARKEAAPFLCKSAWGDFTTQYTGGSVSTWDKVEMPYGRYEVRAKFDDAKVSGIHSAVWLYPRAMTYGPWPSSGEIDIAEYYTRYPDRAIPYLHYDEGGTDPVTNTQCFVTRPTSFHNYIVEWTPGLITVTYDRRRCLTHHIKAQAPLTGSAPFDQPFFLILTQGLGIGQNPFNAATTPLPQTMEVDRVRVWR